MHEHRASQGGNLEQMALVALRPSVDFAGVRRRQPILLLKKLEHHRITDRDNAERDDRYNRLVRGEISLRAERTPRAFPSVHGKRERPVI